MRPETISCLERVESALDPAHLARTRRLWEDCRHYRPISHLPLRVLCGAPDWPQHTMDEIQGDMEKMLLSELAVVYAACLVMTRPLIYVRAFAWPEMPQSASVCADPFFRSYEDFFRHRLFWNSLGDDSIFEPWVTVQAALTCYGWGVDIRREHSDEPGGSFKVDYPLRELADIEILRLPWQGVDEVRTAETAGKLADAIGDILPVNVDRAPAYRMWTGDLSTDLGYLRNSSDRGRHGDDSTGV